MKERLQSIWQNLSGWFKPKRVSLIGDKKMPMLSSYLITFKMLAVKEVPVQARNCFRTKLELLLMNQSIR